MTNFQLLSHLPQLLGWSAAGLGALTALISASFLLSALNTLANIIRFVAWVVVTAWRFLVWATPHVIRGLQWLHETLIWLNDHIDWTEVRITFCQCVAVIISFVSAAVTFTVDHLRRDIPTTYYAFERRFIDVPTAPVATCSTVHQFKRNHAPVGFA